MAHLQLVEDDSGDVVDHIVYCSDTCHSDGARNEYAGWNGCNEISVGEPCAKCGDWVSGIEDNNEEGGR